MEKQTNLIYIFADQWRYHAQGYVEQDQVITPNIDAFAQESMCFTNACSTFPLCSPHRASLMTGKYPFRCGMWTNCKVGLEEKIMLKPQEICIGNVLQEHGYHTGYIGKWHLDASENNFVKNPKSGAVDWDAYTPPGERRQGFEYWISYGADDNHLNPHYWENKETQIRPNMWSPEFETNKAIEYIKSRKKEDSPFTLFLSYNPPHLPYELVPDKYYRIYKDQKIIFRKNVPKEMQGPELETISRQYFGAVTGIDEQFGRILQYLKEQNMEENTVVVLSADHGEMLGSHGLMSKNVWYEESLHIPLFIRHKGVIEARDNPAVFASPDHMPTLLDLLDLPIPDTCDGYSHKKGIFGENSGEPQEMFICSYPGTAEMVGNFAGKGLNHKSYGWRGIRTNRYTYVISRGYNPGEDMKELLYDREVDPYEEHPMSIKADDKAPFIVEFRIKLKKLLNVNEDPFLWEGVETYE